MNTTNGILYSKLIAENQNVIKNLTKSYKDLCEIILHTERDEQGNIKNDKGWLSLIETAKQDITNDTYSCFIIPEIIDIAQYAIGNDAEEITSEQVKSVLKINIVPEENEIIKLFQSYKKNSDTKNKEYNESLLNDIKVETVTSFIDKFKKIYGLISASGFKGVLVNQFFLNIISEDGVRNFTLDIDKSNQKVSIDTDNYTENAFNLSKYSEISNVADRIKAIKTQLIFPTVDNIKNGVHYYPHFHLALAYGRKGLWKVLDDYLDKNQLDRVSGESLYKFLEDYLSKLLYDYIEDQKLWTDSNGLKYFDNNKPENVKAVDRILKFLTTVCFVEDFVKDTALKILTVTYKKVNKDTKVLGKHVSDADSNVWPLSSEMNIYESTFMVDEAYKDLPFFACTIMDTIKAYAADKKAKQAVIGRNQFTGELVTFPLKDKGAKSITLLVAGSRSGKGVLTLEVIATALGLGMPVMYIDGKPDMAKTLYKYCSSKNKSIATVDGMADAGRLPIKIDKKDYTEYAISTMPKGFKEWVENTVKSEKIHTVTYELDENENIVYNENGEPKVIEESNFNNFLPQLIDVIAYTKAIEYMTKICSSRVGKGSDHFKKLAELPFFIIDEIEGYAARANTWLYEEHTIVDGDTGKKKIVRGTLGKLLQYSGSELYKDYIIGITNWFEKVWNDFGEKNTAVFALADISLFIICQHVTVASWCKPIADALTKYANGCRWLLGNESTKGNGSSVFGLAEGNTRTQYLKEHYPGKNVATMVGLGKFVYVSDPSGTSEPVNTCFLVNESTDSKGLASKYVKDIYDRIHNPNLIKIINKQIFGDENADLNTSPVTNKLIGFTDFAPKLLSDSNKNAAELFDKGYKTYQIMLQTVLGNKKSFYENIYDYSPEAFSINNFKEIKEEDLPNSTNADAETFNIQKEFFEVAKEYRDGIASAEDKSFIDVSDDTTYIVKFADTLDKYMRTAYPDLYNNNSLGKATDENIKELEKALKNFYNTLGKCKNKDLNTNVELLEAKLGIKDSVEQQQEESNQESSKKAIVGQSNNNYDEDIAPKNQIIDVQTTKDNPYVSTLMLNSGYMNGLKSSATKLAFIGATPIKDNVISESIYNKLLQQGSTDIRKEPIMIKNPEYNSKDTLKSQLPKMIPSGKFKYYKTQYKANSELKKIMQEWDKTKGANTPKLCRNITSALGKIITKDIPVSKIITMKITNEEWVVNGTRYNIDENFTANIERRELFDFTSMFFNSLKNLKVLEMSGDVIETCYNQLHLSEETVRTLDNTNTVCKIKTGDICLPVIWKMFKKFKHLEKFQIEGNAEAISKQTLNILLAPAPVNQEQHNPETPKEDNTGVETTNKKATRNSFMNGLGSLLAARFMMPNMGNMNRYNMFSGMYSGRNNRFMRGMGGMNMRSGWGGAGMMPGPIQSIGTFIATPFRLVNEIFASLFGGGNSKGGNRNTGMNRNNYSGGYNY